METPSQLCSAIEEGMALKGWNVRDLADQCGAGYENVREIVRGKGYPSKFLLKEIAAKLELDFQELEDCLKRDKVRVKYGIYSLAESKNTSLPIAEYWD